MVIYDSKIRHRPITTHFQRLGDGEWRAEADTGGRRRHGEQNQAGLLLTGKSATFGRECRPNDCYGRYVVSRRIL